MKMILAVVQNVDADTVIDALLDAGHRTTRLASTGGFLREGNTTLLVGVDDVAVDQVIDIFRRATHSRPANSNQQRNVGGATIFVLNLEQHDRL